MEENKNAVEPENAALPEIENSVPSEASTSEADPLEEDLDELRSGFTELSNINSITELDNPIRYAALRDIGLSPSEAYLLTSRRVAKQDYRAHLTPSVPAAAKSPDIGLGKRELEEMREIFGDISDAEIYKLYKKVTK